MNSMFGELLCLAGALLSLVLGVWIGTSLRNPAARTRRGGSQEDLRTMDSVRPFADLGDEMAKTDAKRHSRDKDIV